MTYISILLTFIPLIFLLWLANVADKRLRADPSNNGLAVLTYVLLILGWLMTLTIALFAILMGVAYNLYADTAVLGDLYLNEGMDPASVVAFMQTLPRLGAGLVVLALAGLVILLPPVRRLIARLIPIDAGSVTHAVALSYSIIILLNMWLVMGIGLDAVADAVEAAPESSSWAMIGELWLQNLMLVLMALFGVGWLSRSSFRNVLRRLGLTQPTWRQVGIGIGLGLLAFLLLFPLSLLIEKVGFGIDPDVDRLTEELLGPLMTSLPGVITLGLAAALGEELVYRGALQPRFGIFFTALLFSLTHSQYGISVATLIVLALGLLLGWTRKRYNTTTAILLHATYNIAIGLSGFLLQ